MINDRFTFPTMNTETAISKFTEGEAYSREENEELRPCPFCGFSANVVWDIYRKKSEVICSNCGARTAPAIYGRSKIPLGGKRVKNEDEARKTVVEFWNRRCKG